MRQKDSSVNDRAIRKFLMASLCLLTATTLNLFTPTTATAQWPWFCADECEEACEAMGSSCAGFFYSEGVCNFECN